MSAVLAIIPLSGCLSGQGPSESSPTDTIEEASAGILIENDTDSEFNIELLVSMDPEEEFSDMSPTPITQTSPRSDEIIQIEKNFVLPGGSTKSYEDVFLPPEGNDRVYNIFIHINEHVAPYQLVRQSGGLLQQVAIEIKSTDQVEVFKVRP